MANDDHNFGGDESDATDLLGLDVIEAIDGAIDDATARAVVSDAQLRRAAGATDPSTSQFAREQLERGAARQSGDAGALEEDGPATNVLSANDLRAKLASRRAATTPSDDSVQTIPGDAGARPTQPTPAVDPRDSGVGFANTMAPGTGPNTMDGLDNGPPTLPVQDRRPNGPGQRAAGPPPQPGSAQLPPRPARNNDSLALEAPDLSEDDYENATDMVDAATASAIAERLAQQGNLYKDNDYPSFKGGLNPYDSQDIANVELPVDQGPQESYEEAPSSLFAEDLVYEAQQIHDEIGKNLIGRQSYTGEMDAPVDTGERLQRAIDRVQNMGKQKEGAKLKALREEQVNRAVTNWPDAPKKEQEVVEEVQRPWTAPRAAALTFAATVVANILVAVIVLMAWFDFLTAVAVYAAMWAVPAVAASAYMNRAHQKRVVITAVVVTLGVLPMGAWALPEVRKLAVAFVAPEVSEQHAGRVFMDPDRSVVFLACEEFSTEIDFRGQIEQMGKVAPGLAVGCARRIVPEDKRRKAMTVLADSWAREIRNADTCAPVANKIEAYMETRKFDDHQDARGALLTALNTTSSEVRDCAIAALTEKLEGQPASALGDPTNPSVFDEGLFAFLTQHAFVPTKESKQLKLSSNAMQIWTMQFGCQALLNSGDSAELVDRMNGMARTVSDRQDFWVNRATWARWCIEFDGTVTKQKIRDKVEEAMLIDAIFVARGFINKAIYQRERRFLAERMDETPNPGFGEGGGGGGGSRNGVYKADWISLPGANGGPMFLGGAGGLQGMSREEIADEALCNFAYTSRILSGETELNGETAKLFEAEGAGEELAQLRAEGANSGLSEAAEDEELQKMIKEKCPDLDEMGEEGEGGKEPPNNARRGGRR